MTKNHSILKSVLCLLLVCIFVFPLIACSDDAEEDVLQIEGIAVQNGDYATAIDSANVGDFFLYGELEQNESNIGKEPIQWRVIDKNENGIFLISELILDYSKYLYDGSEATWDTSYIHESLNQNVYNFFSEDEIKHIRWSNLVSSDNPQYDTDGGAETIDRLFLLSYEEATKYFGDESALCAGSVDYPTSYDAWWLRTPGEDVEHAMFVTDTGSINNEGESVEYGDSLGVRPAMWIMKNEQADIFGPKTRTYKEIEDADMGDMVLFGSFEIDGNSSEQDPIEWIVLSKGDDKLLLLSRYIIAKRDFGSTYMWKDCQLRDWLNSVFYNNSFSNEEKGKIQKMITSDKTNDKVFLLSAEEARLLFASDSSRRAFASDYQISNGFKDYYGTGDWWTRSVSTAIDGKGVVTIQTDGEVRSAGTAPSPIEEYTNTGVRPAICVDISGAKDKAVNMKVFGYDSNRDLDNEIFTSSFSGSGGCPACNGTGYVRYYYGSSDLQAFFDGYDPYTVGRCTSCN